MEAALLLREEEEGQQQHCSFLLLPCVGEQKEEGSFLLQDITIHGLTILAMTVKPCGLRGFGKADPPHRISESVCEKHSL